MQRRERVGGKVMRFVTMTVRVSNLGNRTSLYLYQDGRVYLMNESFACERPGTDTLPGRGSIVETRQLEQGDKLSIKVIP